MAEYQQTGPFSRRAAQRVEGIPGAIYSGIANMLRRPAAYLGSTQAAQDFEKLLQGKVNIGRSALAGPQPLSGDPTGRYVPGFMQPGIAGADIGGDGRSDEARALASQYAPKPFPMTQEGQFDRYFKTPEFDYVFGAQTGKGPKTAAELATLGTQRQAPTSAPLSDYYRSQSALGRVNQEEIQKMYADRPDLQKWAADNPMLAQREYVKRQGGRPLAPDQETVMGDLGSRAQSETGYTPQAFGMPANPVPPTQQPGPGGMDQGTRVSYFRGSENIAPLQAMKTTGEGMPAFSTTSGSLSDAADAFVKAMKTKSGAFGS